MQSRDKGPEIAEAGEIFVDFVARRSAGEDLDFEHWVRQHSRHESSLRELYRGWPRFEREIGLRAPAPVLDPDARLAPGALLGDFRLIERLGQGGMGAVWRARQLSRERDVALKVILARRRTPRGISFFAREARAAQRIRHPGVVEVHEAGESDGLHWIAQELVPGRRTLADFLEDARSAARSEPAYYLEVARIFARIADALAAAHAQGVIHRDLKPKNVLLTPKGEPKLTDFGLARIVDEEALSKTGDFAGTFFYMSPEQVAARRIGIDHRTDVFSLGVVLYEALTLRRPFDAPTDYEVAEKILYEEPPDPQHIQAGVPVELAWICAKAMEKRRGDRFASMQEMRDELWRYVAEQPVLTRPMGLLRRARKRLLLRPVRSALIAAGLAVATLVLVLHDSSRTAGADARHARMERALAQAALCWELGELERADEEWARAIAIAPENPLPHLERASFRAIVFRTREMGSDVEEAWRKGFRPSFGPDASAEELRNAAMHLVVRDGLRSYERAEELLERALAQRPGLYAAAAFLYQLRMELEDFAGAKEALLRFRSWIKESAAPELAGLVEALVLELDGDLAGAARRLEAFAQQNGQQREGMLQPRLERVLGRVRLRALQPELAEQHLLAALEEDPEDTVSAMFLTDVELQRSRALAGAERERVLERAEARAKEALERWPERWETRLRVAGVAVTRVLHERASVPPEQWDEAWARVEAAMEVGGHRREVRELAGELRICEAHLALRRGDAGSAVELFRAGLEDDPQHVFGWFLLAQALYLLERPGEALDALERGLESYERGLVERPGVWKPALCAGIHIWILVNAGKLGLEEPCARSVRSLEELVDGSLWLEPEELVTYAEFLAEPPSGLAPFKDCERVHELFERYPIRQIYAADPRRAERARTTMEVIERNCFPR